MEIGDVLKADIPNGPYKAAMEEMIYQLKQANEEKDDAGLQAYKLSLRISLGLLMSASLQPLHSEDEMAEVDQKSRAEERQRILEIINQIMIERLPTNEIRDFLLDLVSRIKGEE